MSEQKEKVAALWLVRDDQGEKKRDKNGNVYFTGKDEKGRKVIGFYNTNKTNPKQPDLNVLYQTDREQPRQQEPNNQPFVDDSVVPF